MDVLVVEVTMKFLGLASKVVIMAGLVAADSPATPLLRAATNKEYVVPG
jgi:hypothetical protein